MEKTIPQNAIMIGAVTHMVATLNAPTLIGTPGNDVLVGTAGNDVIDGGAGTDTLTGGAGADNFLFDRAGVADGLTEDTITDFSISDDRFLLDSLSFGVNGALSFARVDANASGASIPASANVIVLLNSDNDNNPATAFNARSAATQIAGLTDADRPGFFVYFNSGLNLNRLVFSSNLNDPNAPLEIVARLTDLTGADAIAALADFSAANFAFEGNVITGTAGNDALAGTSRSDTLDGGDGNDTLNGQAGADVLIGGNGNDVFNFAEAIDTIVEAADGGTDEVRANTSFDLTNIANVENLTLLGGAAIVGTGNALANVITGSSANNVLSGAAGNDTLSGLSGNDVIDGGAGTDILTGGSGADNFFFDRAAVADGLTEDTITDFAFASDRFLLDSLSFGVNGALSFARVDANASGASIPAGANVIVLLNSDNDNNPATAFNARSAATQIAGLTDADRPGFFVYFNSGLNLNRLVFSSNLNDPNAPLEIVARLTDLTGADAIAALADFSAANFAFEGNVITGTAGNDALAGTSRSDTLDGGDGNDTLNGQAGADVLTGRLGNDIYFVDNAGDVVTEAASEGTDEVRATINYTLGANIENLRLNGGAALIGTGNALANSITAGVGPATLSGLAGNDTLFGSAAADLIDGGGDNDTLFGRNGNDTLNGGDGNDVINGQENSDTINGGEGDDTLRGDAGNDLLSGGNGNDRLEGGIQVDTLSGNDGNDILLGGDGNDNLDGGIGNDLVEGGTGRDSLRGGDGLDRFRFDDGHFAGLTGTDSDRILDFAQAQGDRIDLSLVDAISGGGDNAFTFIGSGAFTGVAGQLRFAQSGSFTLVSGDTNGDGTADFAIRIDGLITLVAADFVL